MEQQSAVPRGYESTNKKAYGSQQKCAAAWSDMKWPENNEYGGGESSFVYSSENFEGHQYSDGSGELMHYDTREAIRLSDGTVISNTQCWSEGFAHCTTPHDIDAALPLSAVEEHLDSGDDIMDIQRIVGQPETVERTHSEDTYETHRPENTAVVFENYTVVIGRDTSIKSGNSGFTFRIDVGKPKPDSSADDVADFIDDYLLPNEVANSGYEVVSSDEYSKNRLDQNERTKHLQAGGKLSDSRSRWRDEKVNYQHYRADLQGNVIVRQGEWFFIPTPMKSGPRNQGNQYAADQLGSHVPQRKGVPRSPLPQECGCACTRFDMGDDGTVTCESCNRSDIRQIYVCGEIIHSDGDHDSINLGNTWHRAVTHNKDVRVYERHPTKGSHGRARWD